MVATISIYQGGIPNSASGTSFHQQKIPVNKRSVLLAEGVTA